MARLADAEGHLTKTYRYGVTGGLTYGSATYENEYTYNGESYNSNIQSQYLRARYYNVVTMNFLTEDSKGDGHCLNLRNKVKDVVIVIIIIIVIQIGCIVASYLSPAAKIEKSAVFPLYAYIMQCTDDYYIVGRYGKYDHAGTAMYYYRDGFTKKPVEITGNSPYHAVDTRLLPDSIFLVKGKFNEEMSDYLGTDILVAESWDIIAPIHRFVEGNCLEQKNRVLAPWWYLDEYDLSVGAYKQVDEKSRKILYWEEEWFRHIWEGHCLAVTAEMDGNEVKWYSVEGEIRWNLMDDKIFTRVQLAGDTPEIYFKNCMTDPEIKQVLDNKKSYFLIHGDYGDSGIFWVDEWHALSQIW